MKIIPVILIAFFCSCNEYVTEPVPANRQAGHAVFVPGEVIAGVDSGTTHAFIVSFADSLDLSVLNWTYDEVQFWIEIPRGTARTYIPELAADSLFTLVFDDHYPYADADTSRDYLRADYELGKDASDTSLGRIAVQELGLNVKRVEFISREGSRDVTLSVPKGSEIYWSRRLSSYPFVRYASPVYFAVVW